MIPFSYPKQKKRGISTVLGVLLMVGILFTTVIPLYLYINSVNNYYDRAVVNAKIADQERSMEDLDVYVFGHNETSTSIDVAIINRAPLTITVTRIWVMRSDLQKILIFTAENVSSLPLQLIASDQLTIGDLDIAPILGDPDKDYFNIEVTTARGNVFPSETNPLHHNGGWVPGENPPWVEVMVRSDWDYDSYRIEVFNVEEPSQSHVREIDHIHGDYFTIIPIYNAGVYNVTAWNTHHGYRVGSKEVIVENTPFGAVALAYFTDIK
jgi:hypothetical protein